MDLEVLDSRELALPPGDTIEPHKLETVTAVWPFQVPHARKQETRKRHDIGRFI